MSYPKIIHSSCLQPPSRMRLPVSSPVLLILIAFQVQLLSCSPTNKTISCDLSTHHDCVHGRTRCIPLEWMCDNVPDCETGDDEIKCSYLHSCMPGFMMCRSGECVAQIYKCDGEEDCTDGSDEKHCSDVVQQQQVSTAPRLVSKQECLAPRMRCSSGQCLAPELVCDGHRDCSDGGDEANCGQMTKLDPNACRSGQMMCKSREMCIPESWVCDGSEDCEDGSDEDDCGVPDLERFIFGQADVINKCAMQGNFHCASDAASVPTCIPLNATCNGVRDCPQGDDESPLCNECRDKNCQHTCVDSPKGAQCVCQSGWKLDADGESCVDEDECATHGHLCQQYCEDAPGSYSCKCAPGYVLGSDRHSCRLDRDHEGLLFISLGTEIRHMPLTDAATSNDGYTTIQRVGAHGTARSLDFMHKNGQLFLATSALNGEEGELSVSNEGLLRVLRENVSGIGYIAVDWMGGNIFFTQKAPAKTVGISVCTMNGFFCRWLIRGQGTSSSDASHRQNYRGLAVHPLRGQIVYIDSYAGKNRIMSANMDGTNIRALVDNKLEYPSGLAIDLIRNDVYFGDVERKMIERVNMDTRDRRVVISSEVSHPYDMRVFNGFIYWADWGSETLKVAELNHHTKPHTLHSFSRFPYGIALNHSMYQPMPSRNPCDESSCPWICVMTKDSEGLLVPRCVCPDGYTSAPGAKDDCVPPSDSANYTQYSHIGTALMKEYCEHEMACLNGGVCVDVTNEHGRVQNIVCDCPSPYEGSHCERLNPEKQMADSESSDLTTTLVFVIALLLAIVLLVVICVLYKENDIFREHATRAIHTARDAARDVNPIVAAIKQKMAGRGSNRASHVVSSGTLSGNALVDPETGAMSSPSSYHNPLYDEVPTEGSPIAGGLDVSYRAVRHL